MSEWQDIATAPMNEIVLVHSRDAAPEYAVMVAAFYQSDDPEDDGDWYPISDSAGPLEIGLTHWMPLPSLPERYDA